MNRTFLFALATSALVSTAACVASPSNEEESSTASALSLSDRVRELKQEIVAISNANTLRTDNFAEVTAELKPLVDELQAIAPHLSQAETLDRLEGVWHSLWSNLEIGGPGVVVDLAEVYQVVTKGGYYYNLSNARALGFLKTVGVLRGAYTSEPDGLAIEFTRTGYRVGTLRGDLFDLTQRIESGSAPVLYLPARAPRGPVGITGKLTTIFVDDELRISGGFQAPFLGADGAVQVPGKTDLLFVLERQTTALP